MARTIVDLFRDNLVQRAERPALRHRVEDRWETLTWADYGRAVREACAGLDALGIQPGESVGILSWNRVEWPIADLAVLALGAITVPVYPTNTPRQVAYVLGHGEVRVCLAEDDAQLAKILAVRDELPKLDHVVLFEGDVTTHAPFVVSLDDLRASGAGLLARDPGLFDRRADELRTEQVATIVYTSGTTGPPKGAMITHGNISATVEALLAVVGRRDDERFLSFLPLSHIAERVTSHFMQITEGGETWFARSIGTVAEDLRACRPTAFLAVPRVWQKFHDKIAETLAAEHGVKGRVARRYVALGLERVRLAQLDKGLHVRDRVTYEVLDRLVGGEVRHTLGLDRARVLVSSAAPIHPSLVAYFHALGLPIAEVYGQTEDCGPTTMNPPSRIRVGTVGPPLPNLSLRLGDDGELLVRGPTVCTGYFKDPVATDDLLDPDGWMRTGDIATIGPDGYVTITGRKKDIIINAAGKNITPQEIEARLRMEPLVSQAVLVGDGRRFLTALLTLDADAVTAWAAERGRQGAPSDLLGDADLQAEVAASVARANEEHAPVERVRKWRVLPRDFSMEADELTPTLKVRRAAIVQKYADMIEEMYGESA